MAEDILKRINAILVRGIKETGIDFDPTDTSKYGFAPEHSSLIRELEELELLEELQELVGGEGRTRQTYCIYCQKTRRSISKIPNTRV